MRTPHSEPPGQATPAPDASRSATEPANHAPNPVVETTDTSGFGVLGWLTANTDGCIVQFGIEQQAYLLATTLPNYNTLFAQLLGCWLNACKVSLTYQIPTFIAGQDPNAPRHIVSAVAFAPNSSGG